MHELRICANTCCRRYNKKYSCAMEWLSKQDFEAERLLVTHDGNRECNHCSYVQSWDCRECPKCKTRLGMLAPDAPIMHPLDKQEEASHSAEFWQEAAAHFHCSSSGSAELSQNMTQFPIPDPAGFLHAIAQAIPREEELHPFPECEVCGWLNPVGCFQCERCTSFM